jgi:hypothetical protein
MLVDTGMSLTRRIANLGSIPLGYALGRISAALGQLSYIKPSGAPRYTRTVTSIGLTALAQITVSGHHARKSCCRPRSEVRFRISAPGIDGRPLFWH